MVEGVIEQLWTAVMGECWAWQVVDFFFGGDAKVTPQRT